MCYYPHDGFTCLSHFGKVNRRWPGADVLAEPDLPAPIAQMFLAASTRRVLLEGEELYAAGSSPTAMYGVLSGAVRVGVTAESGAHFHAATLTAGRWFCEVPLLDNLPRVFHAYATMRSEIAVLAAVDFSRLIGDRDTLLAIALLACRRYRQAIAWIEDANLYSLRARLASRLAALSKPREAATLAVRISQVDLANQLGVSRQSVNRQLKLWERAGLIRIAYGILEIHDLPRLLQERRE